MNSRLWPRNISLGLLLVQLMRLYFAYDALPPSMASHFDLAGKANGFQSKSGFAWTSALLSAGIFTLFAFLPALLARLPDRLVNLPNKDYWLAPERRAETLVRLGLLIDWLGCATLGLLVGVFELIVRVNLSQGRLGYQLWLLLIGYHLFMWSWIISYLRALRRPDGA